MRSVSHKLWTSVGFKSTAEQTNTQEKLLTAESVVDPRTTRTCWLFTITAVLLFTTMDTLSPMAFFSTRVKVFLSPVKFLSLSRTGLRYRRPPNTCRLCDGAYVIVHRGRAVTCRVSLQSRVKSRLLLQYWLVKSWKLLHKTPPAILSPQSQNTWISWKAFEDRWGRGGSGCRQVSVIPQQKWFWGEKLKITL